MFRRNKEIRGEAATDALFGPRVEKKGRGAAPTDQVLVAPRVIAASIVTAARHRRNEVGALLLGRTTTRGVRVENLVHAENVGTRTNVHFSPRDFDDAQDAARDGQLIVGWMHSHPGYGVFHSATDVRFQSQGQGLFPDFVGLVVDPFRQEGVGFGFFRAKGRKPVRLEHDYLPEEATDEA